MVAKVLSPGLIVQRTYTYQVRDERIVPKDDMYVELFRSIGTQALCIRFGFDPQVQLEVYTTAEQSHLWPDFCVLSEMSGNTDSNSSFNRALQWLDECTSTHDVCNASSGDQPMPRRLIDITTDKPKLIEDHGLVGRYVCLSHCWGGHQPLRTITATIQQHIIGIPWDAIPRTFQDAIQITKRLHINYIWIDSLCIVQDDADDWAAQAAQMANIYSNAYLTIAATCAPNSTHGLFSQTPAIYLPETIHLKKSDGSSHPLQVRHSSKFHMLESYQEGSGLPWSSSTWLLLSRAWVFQERLLSPRLLHFSFSELIWECRHTSACECSAIHSTQVQSQGESYFTNYQDVFHFHLKRRVVGAEGTAGTWHDVVAAFTGLQISFKKDVFPALSGIAQRIHKKRKSRYLAGLWQDSLCADLVWDTSVNKKRLDNWRAPSWSWASVETAISFLYVDQAHATLLEASIVPTSGDVFGELEYASITLRGWLFCAETRIDQYGRFLFKLPKLDVEMASVPSINFDDEDERDLSALRFLKVASVYLDTNDARHNPSHLTWPYYTYHFLVLEVSYDQQDAAVFQRVGIASFDMYEVLPEEHSDILGSQEILKLI
jgi:hypothetical protein